MLRISRNLQRVDRKFIKKGGSDTTAVPYYVKRSAEGNLAVYCERVRMADRSYEYVTKVGGLYGNSEAFASDAKNAVGATNVTITRRKALLNGNLVDKVKQWLHKSGF
jgi:Mitochondrial large subunit ribosomal protein (Img2)